MKVTSAARTIAFHLALGAGVLLPSGGIGWSSQSQPQQKDTAGAQAGSSGKAGEQMGSEGTTESPLRRCDSVTTKSDTKKKAVAKKKAKKPATTTKTGSGSSTN
jgi:hypothetical protein